MKELNMYELRKTLVTGLTGILVPLILILGWGFAIITAKEFSLSKDPMSKLSSDMVATLYFSFPVMISGGLMLIFNYSLFRYLPRHLLTNISVILFGLGAISLSLYGAASAGNYTSALFFRTLFFWSSYISMLAIGASEIRIRRNSGIIAIILAIGGLKSLVVIDMLKIKLAVLEMLIYSWLFMFISIYSVRIVIQQIKFIYKNREDGSD